MKIYTRTGDRGQTSLFGGKRVSKASLRVDAYGTVDELNSAIGVAIATVSRSTYKVVRIKKELLQIQNDLLQIGAALANPEKKNDELRITSLEQRVKDIEQAIDQMTGKLPELRNFILPGGGNAGAMLHLVRSVCRRAERRIIELSQKEEVSDEIIIYVNRLSDYFFTVARFVNRKNKVTETIWSK